MRDGFGAVGGVVGLLGLLFALLGGWMCLALVRGAVLRHRALTRGLPAQARCLETYVTRDADGDSHRKAVLGFHAEDGREVRVSIGAGRTMVTGDLVQVRYLPQHPERAAVVGSGGPASLVVTVIAVAGCLVFTLAGLLIGAVGLGLGTLGFGAP